MFQDMLLDNGAGILMLFLGLFMTGRLIFPMTYFVKQAKKESTPL